MAEREKVILGLESYNGKAIFEARCPFNCPYAVSAGKIWTEPDCCEQLIKDALALLKEQEPRVMSWEEVDKSGNLYVWTEIHSFYPGRGCLVYCTVVRSEFFDELFKLREDSGIDWTRAEEDYNRDNYQGVHSGWRCWTARPTEKQRRDTKWEGEDDG